MHAAAQPVASAVTSVQAISAMWSYRYPCTILWSSRKHGIFLTHYARHLHPTNMAICYGMFQAKPRACDSVKADAYAVPQAIVQPYSVCMTDLPTVQPMGNVTFDGHAQCRTMYKLLRSTCLHCFQLKMRQTDVDKYTEKLQLLAKGKLTEAAAVLTGGGKAAETAKSFVEAGDDENANENMLKGKGKHKANGSAAPLDGALMIHP